MKFLAIVAFVIVAIIFPSCTVAQGITDLGDKLKEFVPRMEPQLDAFTKKLNEKPENILGKSLTELLSKLHSNNKNVSNADDPNVIPEEENKTILTSLSENIDSLLPSTILLTSIISFVLALFEDEEGERSIKAFIKPLVTFLSSFVNAVIAVLKE